MNKVHKLKIALIFTAQEIITWRFLISVPSNQRFKSRENGETLAYPVFKVKDMEGELFNVPQIWLAAAHLQEGLLIIRMFLFLFIFLKNRKPAVGHDLLLAAGLHFLV